MSDKLNVKIKLSRWRAKIVTSLLPIPALGLVVISLDLGYNPGRWQVLSCYTYFVNVNNQAT